MYMAVLLSLPQGDLKVSNER